MRRGEPRLLSTSATAWLSLSPNIEKQFSEMTSAEWEVYLRERCEHKLSGRRARIIEHDIDANGSWANAVRILEDGGR